MLAIGLVAGLICLLGLIAPLLAVVSAQASASGAADASALAAADVRVGISTGFPCEVAAQVARANGTELTSCRLDGLEATVSVACQVAGFELHAIATAGPPR
jgi:secretion/DNA translocation related TadE-like protein